MSISHRIQELVAKQNFDAIEGEWLVRMEENLDHLDYFVAVARTLTGQGEEGRARLLLEMLDEHLKGEELWRERLSMLKRAGDILRSGPEAQHRDIMESLEHLHGHHASFKGLVENVGLDKAKHDIPKTWDKVGRLESLVTFDLGSVVSMEGKGAGRVVEVNLELQSFRIDFEGFPRLAVGFRAAPKVLTAVPPEHIHYRTLEDAEALKKLADEDPPELLRIVLESYDQPRSAGDIKADLSTIVPAKRWTSWWAAARKHPQVVTGGKGRQTYAWAASSEDAQETVWKAFEKADPRKKIQLLRRDGDRDEALRKRMARSLIKEAEVHLDRDPGLALEIWFNLQRTGDAPEDVPFAPQVLLGPDGNPRSCLTGLEDRSIKEEACRALRQYRDDWATHYMALLSREDDPRVLDLLADSLEKEDHPELGRFYDGTVTQPNKAPGAFTWLVEKASNDEALRSRSPLRLFQQILAATTAPELVPYRLRLLAQTESGGTVVKLLTHLNEDTAAQAEEALERAAGLESYQREDLLKALHLRFPSLRQESHATAALYALTTSIDAKRDELNEILKKEIPANRKAIEEARAMGDLRENFEYKSARQRHEYLTARATELKEQLARARPIEFAHIDPSEARVGTRVAVEDGEGGKQTLTILGPWESNPDAGVISYESELGKAMLGKGTGTTVKVGGKAYTLVGIEIYEP